MLNTPWSGVSITPQKKYTKEIQNILVCILVFFMVYGKI